MIEDLRYNMCTRKRGYLTRKKAKKVVRKMKLEGIKRIRSYKCMFCSQFHVEHPKPCKCGPDGLLIDDI